MFKTEFESRATLLHNEREHYFDASRLRFNLFSHQSPELHTTLSIMSDLQMQTPQTVPDLQYTTLVPELLGFSPQLLLDDIISAAADAVFKCLQALEQFMQDWANKRSEGAGNDWDGLEAVEQGLVAFSTLLEFHTDIAFDFFEAWSLRNIFAVPPGLSLVAPHHAGRNLITKPEDETELMADIEDLRRKLENVGIN